MVNKEFVHYKFLLLIIVSNWITASRSSTISRFQKLSDGRFTSDLGTTNVYTVEACIYLCTQTPSCLSISYKRLTQQCDLGSEGPKMEQITVDLDWIIYYKTELNGSPFSTFVLVDTKMTWTDANNYCHTTYSGHLANINTEAAMNQVISLMDQHPHVVAAWAGARDSAMEGSWVWTDNTPVNDGYTRWQPTQPDNNLGDEDCLVLHYQQLNYQWNDIKCSMLSHSICEY